MPCLRQRSGSARSPAHHVLRKPGGETGEHGEENNGDHHEEEERKRVGRDAADGLPSQPVNDEQVEADRPA